MQFWNHLIRVYNIVLFRIQSDQCFLRASSLTFQTMLSIVPLFAIMFGIAKGFGIETLLENILRREFHDQKEIISHYIDFGYSLLSQVKGGIIAGVGVFFLLITVMRLLSNIENSLNVMWAVKTGRTLIRMTSDYLAIILICPILLTASSSITVFVTTSLQKLSTQEAFAKELSPILLYSIPLIPYIMSTLLFMIVYIIMPHVHVKLSSSFWAGLFAGCSYQILQTSYIGLQLKISNAGAIYGSFAALPLFMMWLYTSWLLFLIGAEIVVIHQERLWDAEILAPYRNLTPLEKNLVMLACTKATIDSFLEQKPITIEDLAQLLKMSERQVTELVEELCEAHLTYKVQSENGQFSIVPAQNPALFRITDATKLIAGPNNLISPYITCFEQLTRSLNKELEKSPTNQRLQDVKI